MPHVAEKMMAAIPSNKRMPSGVWGFDGNTTNGGYFQSGSNTGLGLCPQAPNLGQKSWVNITYCLATAAGVNDFIWSIKDDTNGNNYMYLARNSTGSFQFIYRTAGVDRVTLTRTANAYGAMQIVIVWRDGDTWGMGVYSGNGVTVTPDLDEVTATFAVNATGDTYNTTIRNVEATKVRIGHFDGTTGTFKFAGYIGPIVWAIAPSGGLSAYNLSTKAQRKRCCRDLQYIFHTAGFTTSDVMAYGNWADSSGTPKSTLTVAQIAANDRCVCPFTGQYLTFAVASHAAQVTAPPYTLPTSALTRPFRGNWTYLGQDFEERPDGGCLMARYQLNSSFNPMICLDRIEADGDIHSWPILFIHRYSSVDSSASNARVNYYMSFPNNPTHMGDTHSATSVAITPIGIIVSPVFHSDIKIPANNIPDTNDTIVIGDGQFIILRDADEDPLIKDVHPTNPWGQSYAAATEAYLDLAKSYSLFCHQSDRLLEISRCRATNAGKLIVSDIDYATETVRSKVVVAAAGNSRIYPGPAINLPDGYALVCGYLTHDANNNTIGQWGLVVPPKADWADNTKWHAFNGMVLDGASGRPLLGTVTFGNQPEFHMVDTNDAHYPTTSFPAAGAGMDVYRMETPCLISGAFIGIAAIVRKSTANGNVTASTGTFCTNTTSGTWSIPWDTTELWRWSYNTTTKGFTFYDKVDITSILDTLNPGTWPANGSFNTSDVQYLQAQQIGTNRMLLMINDPVTVDQPANKAYLPSVQGYQLRGAIFHDLDGPDPEDYVTLLNEIYSIPTDYSQGYGLVPHCVGQPNGGAKYVGVKISTGDYDATRGWGTFVPKVFDLRSAIKTSLAANGLLKTPRYSGNLQGWI